MTTVLDLISDAMKELGAIGIGEGPTADESQDALRALNQLIQTWQTESLMVVTRQQQVFTYVSGSQTYTIGPGGDFNTTRPIRIDDAYARDPNGNDFDIYVCRSFEDYAGIVSKNTDSSLITAIYYEASYPLGVVHVWPVPSDSSYRLVLWTWSPLSEYTSTATVLSLPPGYERAYRTNLAIDLAARYGRPISPSLAKTALESKAQIKRTNMDIPTLTFDQGLGGSGLTFNYLTGMPT